MQSSKLISRLFVLVLFFMVSCVASPELKLAKQAMQDGDLTTAHQYYVDILHKSPSNKEAKDALDQIRSQITARVRQGAAANLQTSKVLTAPLLRTSLRMLQQASKYDPDGSLLGNDIGRYQNTLSQLDTDNNNRAQKVKELTAAQQFVDAQKTLNAIKQTDSEFSNLSQLNSQFVTNYGAFLEKIILNNYRLGKVEDARIAMAQWQSLGFSKADQDRLHAIIKKQEINVLTKQSRQLIKKKQYYMAFMKLNKSPFKADMQDMMNKIRNNGPRFYLDQARKRYAIGDSSRAYLEAVKGKELNPDFPGIFEMHRDQRDKILSKVQQYIAIPAFDSPKDSPDIGTQFSDALISYLFRILPYGINIVERGKIDILLQEHKREFSQVADILNVDFIVTGNVSLLKIDRQDNKSQSTVRAPIGEKFIVNPEYEAFLQAGTGQNSTIKPPVKTIKIKEYGNFTINQGSSTIKGFAGVAIRIFDTSKGRITYAQEFNANYQATDDYKDSLEIAGIEGDPLTLPTNTEIREKLRKQIVKQVADIVQQQFEKREKSYLKSARYHLSRREKDIAIKKLARGFLYCVKAKINFKDSDFTEIREKIIQLTETDYL